MSERQSPELPAFETPEGPGVRIDGVDYDWFRGNGYLGMFGRAELLRAACEATMRYGLKLRGKRAIGCHPCVLEFEAAAKRFFGTEAVAYFGSGYASTAVLGAALEGRYEVAFVDAASHYSVIDGLAARGKPVVRFAHRDPDDLARMLDAHLGPGQRPLVMSDGIFPISGELAPVPRYWALLEPIPGALLCLDDAHALGVLGERGRGTFEHFGLEGERRFAVGTMSKAFGAYGGVIPCSRELLEAIEARSGNYRGASMPPPGLTAAATRALELVMAEPELRRQLRDNVAFVRGGLANLGLAVDRGSPSPIVCLVDRPELDYAGFYSRLLRERRIALLHVRDGYSGIPDGGALVLTVFATHARAQLERLLEAFADELIQGP